MIWRMAGVRTTAARVALALAAALATGACGGGGGGEFKPAQKKFTSGAASSPGGLTVRSTAFKDGEAIPERYSCKGENRPPPIQWSGVPSGTKSVALVVTDPNAPSGVFVHWIVIGLPTTATGSLSSASLPPGARAEPNSADQTGYTGMCPPADERHNYVFEVMALSRVVNLPPGLAPIDKVKQLRAAASKTGKLTGTFKG